MTLAIIIGFVVGTVAGIFLGMFYFKNRKKKGSQLATLIFPQKFFPKPYQHTYFSSHICRTKHCHTI